MDLFDRNELFGLLGRPLHIDLRAVLASTSEDSSLFEGVLEIADRAMADMAVEAREVDDELGPLPPLAQTPSSDPLPIGASPAADAPASPRNEAAHIRYLLNKAVPRLSRYALKQGRELSVRQRRDKLRKLLVWLFEKEGYLTTTGAPAPYRRAAKKTAGRIDFVVANQAGKALLAVETDWTRETASILKLAHWASQHVPVVWVIGASVPVDELLGWRRFADEVCGHSTRRWLQILHLEHGWVPGWEHR